MRKTRFLGQNLDYLGRLWLLGKAMLVHDWAEKLWHYAYYKAYPPPKHEDAVASAGCSYNFVYLNNKGEITPVTPKTELKP